MRIAIMINTSWNIYNFRMGLIRSLQNDGHEIIAIAPKDAFSDKLVKHGCRFIDLPMDQKGSNPINDWRLKNRMAKVLKNVSPDILLLFTIKPNIYGTLAAHKNGIPVINNVSGLGTVFIRNGITAKIARRLYKWSFKKSNLIFFQNNDDRRDFINHRLSSIEKTDLLPGSGVDLNKFQVVEVEPNSKVHFLMVSRVIYDKGVIEFVEALRLLKQNEINFDATLIGSIEDDNYLGVPKKKIEEWVQEGLLKYREPELDVREVIKTADVVVLPSYREGTPKSLLEAIAMGKPVLTTDVPGCREVVKDNVNGYLCKVKDGRDLFSKMKQFVNLDKESLISMGQQSRRLAESKFDEKIVIEKYKRAIKALI